MVSINSFGFSGETFPTLEAGGRLFFFVGYNPQETTNRTADLPICACVIRKNIGFLLKLPSLAMVDREERCFLTMEDGRTTRLVFRNVRVLQS